MASSSNYLFPQEGLDYLLNAVPRATQTEPTNLYLGLFTTSWSTIQGYGLTNINVQLNTGTYPVTELASTGYARITIASTAWQAPGSGTVTIGSNTINVRQSTTSAAYTFTNSSGFSWTAVNGIFICTSTTTGQASGAGTTVLWYAPFSDLNPVTLANGDSLSVTPTWQSAPYPA
jgi:hypothetical protein